MPFSARTLVDVVLSRASDTPNQPAFRFMGDAAGDGAVLTYGELDRRACRIAAALADAGAAGGRVLLVFPPGLDFIVAFIGSLYADAFMFAGPNGARTVRKEDFLKVVPKMKAYFASIGLSETCLHSVETVAVDSKYLLA